MMQDFGPQQSAFMSVITVLCRTSYYINLLGIKLPLAMCLRASYARYALVAIVFAHIPFCMYCHWFLLPSVMEVHYGAMIWHLLIAMWVTIPLLVVGAVILNSMRSRKLLTMYSAALFAVACFHIFAVRLVQPTALGSAVLQVLFAIFEDGSAAGWVWCLYHVVCLQDHVRKSSSKHDCPIEAPKGVDDTVLIVGNAPTVMDSPLGEIMDGFSHLIRFNTYNLGKPEYTGSKVNFHFCNGRNLPSAREVKAVLPLFNASLTHAAYLFMPHMEDANDIRGTLESSKANAWFVEEDRILALCKKIKPNFWQIPSSGMVAIDAFLSKHEEVALHGFNFFSGKKIHYFEESPLQLITSWLERFVTHNPACEKAWVSSLVDEGRAYFLAEGKRPRRDVSATSLANQEDIISAEPQPSSSLSIIQVLCRMSYYINLLGIKLPLAICLRASFAKYVLGGIVAVYMPFSIYCHAVWLPAVRTAKFGGVIWHLLIALWVTIPLLVVGAVILNSMRSSKLLSMYSVALVVVACFHIFAIPTVQPMAAGGVILQVLFAIFEDGSVAGWAWCLYHVVCLQGHVEKTSSKHKCPIQAPKNEQDTVLVVGNAPTVLEAPLGEVMNGFKDVIRFNTYNLSKPEYTGSKVNFHFCNGRNLPSAREVKAVLPLFNASLTHAAYLFMPHMEEAAAIRANLESSEANAWFVEEERILALIKKIRPNFWQIPSSGMVAIDAFLSENQDVALHGFNFFSGKKIHYFEESPLQLLTSWLERFVTHNPACEKAWVSSLIDEGRAYFLADGKVPVSKMPTAVSGSDDESSGSDTKPGKGKLGKDARRRNLPGFWKFLCKDFVPSQFSF
jgi:hypothetical protein